MKLNKETFVSGFVGGRLGALSNGLDIANLGDPSSIERAKDEAFSSAEKYWEIIHRKCERPTPKSEKARIDAHQWSTLQEANKRPDLLNDFQTEFIKSRINAGEKQFLTPKQNEIISDIWKIVRTQQ